MKRLIVLLIVLFSVTAEAGYIRFFAVAPEIFQDTEENDYTGYQLGSKIVKQTRVEVLGSHAGQDLIMVYISSKAIADASTALPEYLASSYDGLWFRAIAHEAHIKTADPGNYSSAYYTIIKKVFRVVWDTGTVDADNNPILETGTPVEWFTAGMPSLIRVKKPVVYFTGIKEIN